MHRLLLTLGILWLFLLLHLPPAGESSLLLRDHVIRMAPVQSSPHLNIYNLNCLCKALFFAMTQHIHRFQRLGHGHVQGHYSAYHSNQQPESSCQREVRSTALIHFVFCPEKNLSKAQLVQINSSSFCCSLAPTASPGDNLCEMLLLQN